MDRAAFAALVGLDPDLPRALLLPQAIRRLHDADVRGDALRARVGAALRGPAGGSTRVPLPLDTSSWCRDVLDRCGPGGIVADILADPRASHTYLGLANLDAATRAFVARTPSLLRGISRETPGALAAFGDAIRIRDGRVTVPGGREAEAAWSAVVGAPPDRPEAFVRALLGANGGRVAYFYDTASHLDARRRRFALGPTPASATAMAARFGGISASWDVEARPFLRPPIDPATVLLRVAVDEDGRLAGPRARAFWTLALDPDKAADVMDRASVFGGEDADAAWIVERVTGQESRRRLARLQALLFAQRRLGAADTADPADAVDAVRAAIRMPALVFPLERAGLTDIAALAALARRARAITTIASAEDRTIVIAEWQAALSIVVRLTTMGTIDAERAGALLADLAAMEPKADRLDDRMARWLVARLLPLLSAGPAERDGPSARAEPLILDALAGLRHDGGGSRRPAFSWEGTTYVIDREASERSRLFEVRAKQGTASIDEALEAFAIADGLGEGPALASSIDELAARLPSKAPAERGAARTAQVLARLSRALAAPTPDSRAAARERGDLVRAAEHLLADAMVALVYACALGSPDDRLFLAGDVSASHDFGAERPGMPPGPSPPWALPTEQAAAGRPWHMQGALVGLDVALGRLRLRRMLGVMPAHQAVVNGAERAALVHSMILTPGSIGEAETRTVVDAVERGRARVRGASTDEDRAALCREAGLCGWRGELTAWARAEEPGETLASVSRAELAWAGRGVSETLPAAWGTASAVNGELAVRFPPPLPIEAMAGRPTLAHGLTQFADLKLRLAELIVERGLPASLARDLGAASLLDFIDEVQPAFPDDWLAFVRHADRLARDRADDYVSALTVPGGPLVPADAPGGAR